MVAAFAPALSAQASNADVRWDPCHTIRYRVNSTLASSGAGADVTEAIKRVASATGLKFEYHGLTKQSSTAKYPADTDLIVEWQHEGQGRLKDVHDGSADGIGSFYSQVAWLDTGKQVRRIVQGFATLNADRQYAYDPGFGGDGRGLLLMHEIGHAVGLDHSSDRHDIMFPDFQPGLTSTNWTKNDRAQLTKVSSRGGCVYPTSPAYANDYNNDCLYKQSDFESASKEESGPVRLIQCNMSGMVALRAIVAPGDDLHPRDRGLTTYFYRRSGQTGKVAPLGTATIDEYGWATRSMRLTPGQLMSVYSVVGRAKSSKTNYSNTVNFKVS